jgi:hypothetical protein
MDMTLPCCPVSPVELTEHRNRDAVAKQAFGVRGLEYCSTSGPLVRSGVREALLLRRQARVVEEFADAGGEGFAGHGLL